MVCNYNFKLHLPIHDSYCLEQYRVLFTSAMLLDVDVLLALLVVLEVVGGLFSPSPVAYGCIQLLCMLLNKQRSLNRVLHCDKTRQAFENTREIYYISRVFSNVRVFYRSVIHGLGFSICFMI